jgi:hypothetical protein
VDVAARSAVVSEKIIPFLWWEYVLAVGFIVAIMVILE